MSPKSPPFNFFDILQENECYKILKGPFFTFFGTMRLSGNFKIIRKIFSQFLVLKDRFYESEKIFDYLCNRVVFFLLFFFSRLFHENFKFLKNCPYDFHEILHSHSTPKGAPACAKASKSYGWDVRNIAKISPKMAEKQPFFDFFHFSQKCPYDSNEIFCSYSTPY